MQKIFAAVVALALTSGAAAAADAYPKQGSTKDAPTAKGFDEATAYNWSGVYVSGGIGGGASTLGVDNGQGGISLNGIKGDIRAGVDVARNGLLGGVFAQYGISDESLDVGGGLTLDQEDEWMIGARAGLTSGPTLFYVLGTYGQKTYSAGSYFDETFDAWGLGGGIEHQVAKNFSLSLEYVHDWVDVSKYSDDLKATDDTVKLRATYRINSATFGW